MPMTKKSYSARDRLAANLVIFIIIAMIAMAGATLYMTGIFDPVVGTVSLADTSPLPIYKTPPAPEPTGEEDTPKAGLLAWLIPSASAEEAPAPAGGAEDLEALLEGIEEGESESDISEADRISVDKSDLSVNPNLPDDWFNVLLLATDSRDYNVKSGRTDVMIVASLSAQTGEIKLTSLARDMYVPIPKVSGSNRINAAYAYGGTELAIKTVNMNFEMNIQHYVVVNFVTMAAIVDSLGGVDITLYGKEYEEINKNVAVSEDYEAFLKSTTRRMLGENDADVPVHLDGLQAVSYARIRKIDSDIQRGSRQRVLLQAMLDKIMSNATVSTLVNLFNNISRSTETNLAVTKIMEIGGTMLLADSISFDELSLPIPGSYRGSKEKDPRGKEIDVLRIDLSKNVEAMHMFIYGEYIPAPTV